jgi:pyrimidine deaminase RibD-like protein
MGWLCRKIPSQKALTHGNSSLNRVKDEQNNLTINMTDKDVHWMNEAIEWANACKPIEKGIPKVGAIIVQNESVIGRGRRGTGQTGDDDHAELNAIGQVSDKTQLAGATLYTTLEPCTPGVRSKPLECCTNQILHHHIKKVFVGMLDPNQAVTGKGIWALQSNKVDVKLFPLDLALKAQAVNADFIKSQQTLGAKILNLKDGDRLETYKTDGRYTVSFTSNNPPGPNTHLFTYYSGMWWPQPHAPREKNGIWEWDAFFGNPGEHGIFLVTVTDLGQALVDYYRKVVGENIQRRQRVKPVLGKENLYLLRGDYPGISMTGLPKGIMKETSVTVLIEPNPNAGSAQGKI